MGLYDGLGEPVTLLPEVLNGLNDEAVGGTALRASFLKQVRALHGAPTGAWA